MTMRHLITSYQGAVVRHRKRLILALKNMEGVVWALTHAHTALKNWKPLTHCQRLAAEH
jgi:hypothetical protein